MSDETTLIFYDIPSNIGTWSPNTWKTRYSLNFKNIPYKTTWIEYPDIENTLKSLGITPCATKPDGKTPHYTLPAIYDPSTKTGLTDSLAIAEYLDKKYPDKPLLIPPGTLVFHRSWEDALRPKLIAMFPFTYMITNEQTSWRLSPRSEEYFHRNRLVKFNVKKVEDVFPGGEAQKVQEWKKLEEGLGQLDRWYREEGIFVMGDKACFADFVLGGVLVWIRSVFGRDSQEWKDVSSWHNGRWGRMIQALEDYECQQ
ncbi:hypothetical protein VKT23_012927 [Stygiomarasmius scandens]|uniref:GST N-terminal domain-containing protein n=1 Tax=Marasmiellus scandens TaxID=2682957 RepID=A0ABR1J7D9_9AGAR